MQNRGTWLVAITVIILVASTTAAVSAAEYDVQVEESVSVPERTVEQGGDSFTITAIARADPGDSVTVNVDAPEGEPVAVYLYNSDRQIVTSREGTGSGSFSVDLTGYAAGSYTFILQHDGVRVAAQPLVVRGYAVDTSVPTTVSEDDPLRVTVDVTKLRGEDLSNVEVVVADQSTTVRKTASRSGTGTYTATVAESKLRPGSYRVYANVRGSDTAGGEAELLGFTNPERVLIEADSTNDGGVVPARTDTPTTDTPTTDTPTPTAGTPTATTSTAGTATDTTEGSTATASERGTGTTARSGTATPTAGQTTTGSAPTHVPVVLGVAAVVIALLARGRRDR